MVLELNLISVLQRSYSGLRWSFTFGISYYGYGADDYFARADRSAAYAALSNRAPGVPRCNSNPHVLFRK